MPIKEGVLWVFISFFFLFPWVEIFSKFSRKIGKIEQVLSNDSILTIWPHVEHGKIYFYLGSKCALNIFKEGLYEFLFLFLFSFFPDAPRVEMALGKSISPGSIYEGGDVYFDCLVIASPKPKKILWFQDVSKQPTLHSQKWGQKPFWSCNIIFH